MFLFGFAIMPRLFAQALSVPNVLILVAFLLGMAFGGLVGSVLSVPILFCIVYSYRYYRIRRYTYLRAEIQTKQGG